MPLQRHARDELLEAVVHEPRGRVGGGPERGDSTGLDVEPKDAARGSEAAELLEVATLRDTLQRIDAPALADPEGWWAVVVEQAEQGLL